MFVIDTFGGTDTKEECQEIISDHRSFPIHDSHAPSERAHFPGEWFARVLNLRACAQRSNWRTEQKANFATCTSKLDIRRKQGKWT